MATKKLVNDPDNAVEEAIDGFLICNPTLVRLDGTRAVIRRDFSDENKVALLCGGGSGHEPAHVGYMGRAMLSAVVPGLVFTSPPPRDIYAAIVELGSRTSSGVLIIVMNYTGDRLNFGLAAERAKARGIDVEVVIVDDDCALPMGGKSAGRRGLCGTVFVNKIAGALADQGRSLKEVAAAARNATRDMGTIAVSLSSCSVPGRPPSFTLGSNEMELGLGMHGEAGVERCRIKKADEIVSIMIEHMLKSYDEGCYLKLCPGDRIALIVNNLGGTSVLEMSIVARAAVLYLTKNKDVKVERCYVGTFTTSLEMAGVSLSILHVDDTRLQCLDYPTDAPAWRLSVLTPQCDLDQLWVKPNVFEKHALQASTGNSGAATISSADAKTLAIVLRSISVALIENESKLNELDRGVGDGDCGSTHRQGAMAVQEALDNQTLHCDCPSDCLDTLAKLLESNMGGTSGAVYSIFLTAAARELVSEVAISTFQKAFESGIEAVMTHGGAKAGDCTMLDAMIPACASMRSLAATFADVIDAAAKEAELGAQKTIEMTAKAGRSSYVKAGDLKVPDPGAVAVSLWLRAAAEALK
ncbi:triokinase/FMN cyclase-like isoform X2 [Oscarella lobularis]|uniref:triokinase/FMN cyclase-like isoform X2 n=1 Tax=Oscarella lobularis TaxID=121494 RepID=UPI003313ED3B